MRRFLPALVFGLMNASTASVVWGAPVNQDETPATTVGEHQGGAVVVDKAKTPSQHGVKVLSPEELQRREELLREIRKLYQGHPKSN